MTNPIWEQVSNDRYYRKVLGNLVKFGGIGGSVRFGATGSGVAPNYQVKSADGTMTLFGGLSHKPDSFPVEEFEEAHLSPPYDKEAIQTLIGQAVKIGR